MSLNVRKFGVSWFLVLFSIFAVFAQSPTSGDVMRDRIKKAKAFVAVKNYNAAIYELEGIRRETSDATVGSVVQVMLMNCYLEQSDYKRAQSLLNELFNAQKSNKPNANYFAVAAQVVKGARTQAERYKALGLMISDPNLPPDAAADVNKMRETVETVITQSKTLGENKKQTSDAMAILEEATNARSGLARDDFDAKRWKNEVADARESLMNSRSVVNAVDDSGMNAPNNTTAVNTTPANASAGLKTNGTIAATPVSNPNNSAAPPNTNSNQTTAQQPVITAAPKQSAPETPKEATPTPNASNGNTTQNQPTRVRRVENNASQPAENTAANNQNTNKAETGGANNAENKTPIAVGSLIDYATQKVSPVYPPAAKNVRMTGIVRVDVVVSEDGKVAEVQNTSGPSMLQRAALDAVKRWKFKPFMRDGQPVKATGYLSFNFNL